MRNDSKQPEGILFSHTVTKPHKPIQYGIKFKKKKKPFPIIITRTKSV